MLLCCYELKEHINRFIRKLRPDKYTNTANDDDYNPLTDGLTKEDWDDVKELADFLQAPHEMMKRLEGNNSCGGFGSL